ncbi:MAG: ABC transporter ATP-binding protein [Clostridiales bacterium]|nr:ABC transporter ATP-binding protein [Clostridiales bacterium]MCF8023367.1 ABC transporter ATP-binding protein [Clostridiales bacterium]
MEPVITVENLVQSAGKKTILNRVSFEVYRGESLGIFGTGDTGKTSLMHILAGVDKFKSGSVEVLGFNIKKTEKFKRKLGLVTQAPSLFNDLKVSENLDFIAVLKGVKKDRIPGIINQFELENYLDRPVKKLDSGVYQRLSTACALLNEPEILIADEPLRSTDIYSTRIIITELKKFIAEGGTCLWSFKSPEFFDLADRIAWLDEGQVNMLTPWRAREKWTSQVQDIYNSSGENNAQ